MWSEFWGLIVYVILLLGFLFLPAILGSLFETIRYSLRCAFENLIDRLRRI